MTDLPNGWAISKIGDVAAVIRGVTYSKADTLSENDKNSVPLLRATNLQVDAIDFNDMVYVPKKVVKEQQFLRINDIFLAASSGSISVVGKSAQVVKTNGATFGAFCSVIRPKTIHPKFLALWVQSPEIRDHWSATAKGTNINNLKPSDILDTNVPLPPLPEQQKIVELLEDHLSRLDAALADLRSAKSKTSQLKFAILNKVFSGEFFEFDMPILPLEELAKVMNGDRGKNYPNKRARVISGIPFINAGHLDNDLLNIEDMDFISEERYKLLAAGKVELNDLLFCLRGSLGKVAINDKFIEGAIASSLAILRVNAKVLPKYLYYYFLSPLAAIEIKKHDNGTAQPNLSAANLRKFEVPIPTIEQQKIVIDFLDSELSRTIQASQTYDSLFSTASAMRRSLLQAAFTGQLTKEVASV